jgi:molybdenum cofactor cytidylyltransferase
VTAHSAVVVLAAGASRRLGTPKQLLPYRGTTLLAHAARTALEAALGPVFVVLGSDAERCREALEGLDVTIVDHGTWSRGMGTSIAAGVLAAEAQVGCEAILLMTCDQPGVTAAHLVALAAAQRTTAADAAGSAYRGITGTPAILARRLFPALLALPPDAGARILLADPRYRVVSVPCPACALDVDTADQAATLE